MRISTIFLWTAFLAMHGFYFVQAVLGTQFQTCFPLFGFIFVQILCLIVAAGLFFRRMVKGPKRLRAAAWLLLALLPAFIWYSQVTLAFGYLAAYRERYVEPTVYLAVAEPMGAALHDGIARVVAPNRLEGRRAVMRYGKLDDPKRDLESMDAFLESEEIYLGRTLPGKMPWMRMPFFGQPGVSVRGYTYADPEFDYYEDEKIEKEKYPGLRYVDFHEAAHCVISIPSVVGHQGQGPPMLLIEGWAQARSITKEALFRGCRELREGNDTLTLEEMLSREYYHRADDRVYTQGGALVAVLLEEFGPEKFRELYLNTAQKTLPEDLRRSYGMTVAELDAFYWNKIDGEIAKEYEKAATNLTPEERTLLEEFRVALERQKAVSRKRLFHIHLESETLTTRSGGDKESSTVTTKTEIRAAGGALRYATTEGGPGEEGEILDTIYLPDTVCFYNEFRLASMEEKVKMAQGYRKRGILRELRALREYRPETVFGSVNDGISNYLWTPWPGTVIKSVKADGDEVVVSVTSHGDMETVFVLDRSREWVLVLATQISVDAAGDRHEDAEFREYDGEQDGLPLLKSRTFRRTWGDRAAPKEMIAETTIPKRDPAPRFDPTVFSKESLPMHETIEIAPLPPDPARTMYRHWAVIGCWLLGVAFLFRVSSKKRAGTVSPENSRTPGPETQSPAR